MPLYIVLVCVKKERSENCYAVPAIHTSLCLSNDPITFGLGNPFNSYPIPTNRTFAYRKCLVNGQLGLH